ncbi:MAG: acetyl-coenzyme A synthetase, partial [Dehalococcoidia bacterium]|nr:acetyl-coenzyme A synthetase [Dehalococcoidia bacterium]
AVVSTPDPVKGEAIIIFIILKSMYTPSETLRRDIMEHVKIKLGPVATPDEVYFVSELPKTRSGKIMRRVLKAISTGTATGDLSTLEDGASVDEVKRAYQKLKKEL